MATFVFILGLTRLIEESIEYMADGIQCGSDFQHNAVLPINILNKFLLKQNWSALEEEGPYIG